jgi:hypothetical protein
MRKSSTQKISDVLLDYIGEMNIGRKLKEVDIIRAWEEVLGSALNRYTGKIYISGGVLYVQINSPVVKSELSMMREEIRERLNQRAGQEIIKSISFK